MIKYMSQAIDFDKIIEQIASKIVRAVNRTDRDNITGYIGLEGFKVAHKANIARRTAPNRSVLHVTPYILGMTLFGRPVPLAIQANIREALMIWINSNY